MRRAERRGQSAKCKVQSAERRVQCVFGKNALLAVLVLTLSACQAMPRPPRATPVPPSAELRPTAQVGPSPQPADESTPTAAVDLTPLQHLPIGLAVNPATVAGLAPLLQAQDIIKVTAANVGLAAQAGQAGICTCGDTGAASAGRLTSFDSSGKPMGGRASQGST